MRISRSYIWGFLALMLIGVAFYMQSRPDCDFAVGDGVRVEKATVLHHFAISGDMVEVRPWSAVVIEQVRTIDVGGSTPIIKCEYKVRTATDKNHVSLWIPESELSE